MSLLSQVVGANSDLNNAAAQSASPFVSAYDAEMKKTEDAKAEQARLLAEKQKEADLIMAEPIPERPPAPVAAEVAPKPVAPEQSPMKTMAQMLPILAALGSAKTQTGAIAALNASTAALNAMEASDDKALAAAHQDWTDSMKTTLENNKIQAENYTAILEDRKMSWNDKMAKMTALATQYGDKLAMAALQAGNPGAIVERQKLLTTAAEPLQEMMKEAERNQIQREELSLRRQQVEGSIEHDRAQLASQKWTVNGAAGQVAKKILEGAPLNDRDIIVWSAWKESNAPGGGAGGFMAGMPAAAAGAPKDYAADVRGLVEGQPAPAAPPAPAGSTPVAAPPTADSVKALGATSSAPPISLLKEGVATKFGNGQTWTLRKGKAVKVS